MGADAIKKIFLGLFVPLKGLGIVLRDFKILVLSFIPMIIALAIGIYSFSFLWTFATDHLISFIASYFSSGAPGWLDGFGILGSVGGVASDFVQLLGGAYMSYLLLTIVGGPFYSIMAERVIVNRKLEHQQPKGILEWLKISLKMLSVSLLKVALFMCVAIGILIASVLFPLGILASFLLALMVAFDSMDYSFETTRMNLDERVTFFRRHFPAFVGIAMCVVLIGIFPGGLTLTLPLFVAGSADLFTQLYKGEKNEIAHT